MSSTAFVYTHEGFVISADGRSTLADGTITSDSETKIFELRGQRSVTAYSLTGHIGSAFHDLTVEAQKIAADLSAKRIPGGYECANALARGLKRYIGECVRDGLIEDSWLRLRQRADGFARLVVAGYHDHEPFFCTVNFARSEGGKTLLQPVAHPVYPGTAVAEGSDTIQKLIKLRHPMFQERQELMHVPEDTLTEGVRFTRSLIEAMCDDQARRIDPERCKRIGGHIHTASVTPSGFSWVVPPVTK
jgi:hypothetical protein